MWFLLLWGFGIATSVIYFLMAGMPKSMHEVYSIVLLHQFVVTFGLVGIIGCIENIILPKKTAQMVGWPGGPYQIKYGFCQLCLGVMGVMTIWFRGSFWVASLVNMYLYGLSGFWTHTAEMVKNKRIDANNLANNIMNIVYQSFITVLAILCFMK